MLFPIKDYNPTRRTAFLTILLIVINVVVFFYQKTVIPEKTKYQIAPLKYHIAKSAMVPKEVTHFENLPVALGTDNWGRTIYMKRNMPPVLTLLTSMFMHGSIMHLLGNMLFLWIFGNNIEDNLGFLRFGFFYLFCGIAASFIHIIFNWNSLVPVIGASGAVSGVMGAYLLLYPKARIRTLVFILFFITFIDIPAAVFLIVWFIFQFAAAEGVAWLAHVGGFVIGLILIKLLSQKPKIEILE